MAEIIARQRAEARDEAIEAWRLAFGTPLRISMARIGLAYFADAKRAHARLHAAWAAKVREWRS